MKKQLALLLLLLSFPIFVAAQSLDSQFENPVDLTDKQMDDAKNFTHQGMKNRTLKEECAKANDCQTPEEGLAIETIIGKAYALLGIISGQGLLPTLNMKAKGKDVIQDTTEKAKETKPDYCMLAAMAYETVGGMIQKSLQQKADNTATAEGDAQIQALISLRETHRARQKTARFQSYVYGGVTACYTAMLATGAALDWMFIAKMGGASALTGLYIAKAVKHRKAVEAVETVIKSMETAGKNCNPWTKTACFCSELTSKMVYPAEYEEVCVLNKGNFEAPKVALGCAALKENKLEYDKECKCKASNSCLKSNLKAYNPKFGANNNLMNDANSTFDLLAGGEFDQGKLDQAALRQATLATRMKIKAGTIAQPVLNSNQKKMADALKEFMPSELANVAAASKTDYRGGVSEAPVNSAAISKLPSSVREKLANEIKINYAQGSNFDSSSGDEVGFPMPLMPGQEKAENDSTEVLSFAEQAVNKADVSHNPETPIFDIISNRYKRSAWNKLESLK